MSVLGVIWHQNKLSLSCRPDPAKPAYQLEDLCRLDLPNTLVSTIVKMLSDVMVLKIQSQQDYEKLKTDFTQKFNQLLETVNKNGDAQVLLMEPVDHVAFLVPPETIPAGVQTYSDFMNGTRADVTIVAYPTAAVSGVLGRFDTEQPFLLCEWNHELQLSSAVFHEHPGYFSRTETRSRLKGVGPKEWESLIERFLRTKYGIGTDAAGDQIRLIAKQKVLRAGVEAVVQSILDSQPAPRLHFTGINPSTQAHDELSLQLSTREIAQALEPLLQMAANFVSANIEKFFQTGVEIAVLAGPLFSMASFTQKIGSVLLEAGFEIVSADEQPLSTGLLACIRSRPQLPYDCGVLIKKSGTGNGIGTLVLVRPTKIGQERESEVLELPLRQGETLEVAFYVRRLMIGQGEVAYYVMQNHIFAPRVNDSGRVRLRVGMRVDEDPKDDSSVKVTIDLYDLNAETSIHFDKLPITNGEPMRQLPLRNPDELAGVEWAARIDAIRRQLRTAVFNVAAWRKALEESGRSRVPRSHYASIIIDISGIQSGILVDHLQDESIDPDDFQTAGRHVLFLGMRRLAIFVTKRFPDSNLTAGWLTRYPRDHVPSCDDSCAESFVNCLSQDLAENSDGEILTKRAGQMLEFYHNTCQDPHNLNIAW